MINLLGYEKTKTGDAYNVYVSFESSRPGLIGVQTATVYVKEDIFKAQFGEVEPEFLPQPYALNVGFKEIKFKEAKISEWRPYLTF